MTDEQLFKLISNIEIIFDKLKSEQRRRVYMADIIKCKDSLCPMKATCFRYTEKNSKLFDYFAKSPRNENGTCSMYWGDSSQKLLEQLKDIVNGRE